MDKQNEFSRKVYIGINSSGKSYSLKKYDNAINISSSKPTDDSKLTSATQIISERLFNYFNSSLELNKRFKEFLKCFNLEIDKLNEKINDYEITDNLNESILSNANVALSNKAEFKEFFKKTIHNLLDSKLDELGEGHKQLYLIKLFLFNDIKNETLIVDEPETFLHPSLLKDFAITLKDLSKHNKIIATSHSSLFVTNFVANTSEIVIVDPFVLDNSKWIIDRNTPTKKIDDNFWINITNKLNSMIIEKEINIRTILQKWTDFEFDFFVDDKFDLEKIIIWKDKHLTEIIESLFWRNTLLAEGLIEKIIFESFLDPSRWQIINTFGKASMPLIGSILEELGINVAYMLDQDDVSNGWHLEFNKFFDLNKSLFFINDIEDELGISWSDSSKKSYTETKKKVENSPYKNEVFDKINNFLKLRIK